MREMDDRRPGASARSEAAFAAGAKRTRRLRSALAGLLTAAGVAWSVAGCVTAASRPHAPHLNREVLSREELQSTHLMYAYDAVAALRSNWLLERPNTFRGTPNEVVVYVDGVRLGGLSELRAISLGPVYYIRHYDSLEATERWGVGHTQGAIFISTHPF